MLAELRCFRVLLLLLSSSRWLPWNPKRIGAHSARESALLAALLEVKSDGQPFWMQNKRDAKFNKVWGVVSHRQVQRLYCATRVLGIPTALVQPSASPLWQASACQDVWQSLRHTEVHLDPCQFGHKMRRPSRILLVNVDPCFAMVPILFAHTQAQLTERTDPVPCRSPAEYYHSLVQALMAEPHAKFVIQQSYPFNPPMGTSHLG